MSRAAFVLVLLGLLLLAASPGIAVTFEIEGVSGDLRQNVETAIALPPGLQQPDDLQPRWLERHLRQIPGKVTRALQPFGYYEPEVKLEVPQPLAKDSRIGVRIDPGSPVRLTLVWIELSGEGEDDPELLEVLHPFPLAAGERLDHRKYKTGKEELRNRAVDLGYLNADYDVHEIRVDRQSREAQIHLRLNTGGLYEVGEVTIRGGQEYPPWFLNRYLTIEQGDTFTYERLGRTQRNYYNSDRFRSVRVRPERIPEEGVQVPVTVELVSAPPQRLRPGIGYGTDTGARFSLTYLNLNHLGTGNELASDLKLSQVNRFIGSSYLLPNRSRKDASTRLRISLEEEFLDVYENRLFISEIEYQRSFAGSRKGSVFLRLHREDYTVADVREHTLLLLGGVRFSIVRFDDPLRPRMGWQASAEVRGAHPALGSDSALLQVLGNANVLFPLPWRTTVLTRFQGATTLQEDGLEEIPASLRFFAGGDRSVRGYAYQSIGPTNADGEVEGGKKLVVGNLELERALGENWGVALFYDIGSAFNNYTRPDWSQSVGILARRYTQIGPITVAVARQIQQENPAWRLHLNVGFAW